MQPDENTTYSWKTHLQKALIGWLTRKFVITIFFGILITIMFVRLPVKSPQHWMYYVFAMLGLAGVLNAANALKKK